MRSKQKIVPLASGALLTVLAAGCSGVNASKSVSPLDFILPGLIQTAPRPAAPVAPATNSVQVVAFVR